MSKTDKKVLEIREKKNFLKGKHRFASPASIEYHSVAVALGVF